MEHDLARLAQRVIPSRVRLEPVARRSREFDNSWGQKVVRFFGLEEQD